MKLFTIAFVAITLAGPAIYLQIEKQERSQSFKADEIARILNGKGPVHE